MYEKTQSKQTAKLIQTEAKQDIKEQVHVYDNKIQYKIAHKSSLCRFFLRGNCPNLSSKCLFAHGIQDLNYCKYNEEQESIMKQVYNDFRYPHPINQLDVTVPQDNKIYVNLYNFQSINAGDIQNGANIQDQKSESTEEAKHLSVRKQKHEYQHTKQEKQYNPKLKYSLEQINNNRNLKIQIRKQFHQHQFHLFLQLIERQYGGQEEAQQGHRFYAEILELEYFRVGFNKLMTRIKLSFLIDYLQSSYKGGHFKFVSIMPPLRNKASTYYLKLAPQHEIIEFYKTAYAHVNKEFKDTGKDLREEDIRNFMIKCPRDWWKIPPITQLLRIKHSTFKEFMLTFVLDHDKSNTQYDWVSDESIQITKIHKLIEEQILKMQYCIVADILSQNPKFNRALVEKCVSNQRKEVSDSEETQKKLQQNTKFSSDSEKLILIKCPNIKTQIVTKQAYLHPDKKYERQFGIGIEILIEDVVDYALKMVQSVNTNIIEQQLVNSLQEQTTIINKQALSNVVQELQKQTPDTLDQYKVIDVSTADEFCQHYEGYLKSATLLGVDLEGSLADSENGFLSLIQINHYSHKIIYLIDYLTISSKEPLVKIKKVKNILTKLFNDLSIVKIIHDSRNDAQCLYQLLKKPVKDEEGDIIKLTNIFDTAASEQVIRQLEHGKEFKLSTPGLNEVLQKYGQVPNPHKKKFHSIWIEGKEDPSIQRPMSKQFKEYCAMDVLGLPKVYTNMSKIVNPYFLVLVSQMHANWSQEKDKKQNQSTKIKSVQ